MRHLIEWMLDNLKLPTDFEALRADSQVALAAEALGMSVNKLAVEIESKTEQRAQKALKLPKNKKEDK